MPMHDETKRMTPEELMKLKQKVIHGDPFKLSGAYEGIAIARFEKEGSKLHVFGRDNPVMNDWQAWVPANGAIITRHEEDMMAGRNTMMLWVPDGVQVKLYRFGGGIGG